MGIKHVQDNIGTVRYKKEAMDEASKVSLPDGAVEFSRVKEAGILASDVRVAYGNSVVSTLFLENLFRLFYFSSELFSFLREQNIKNQCFGSKISISVSKNFRYCKVSACYLFS